MTTVMVVTVVVTIANVYEHFQALFEVLYPYGCCEGKIIIIIIIILLLLLSPFYKWRNVWSTHVCYFIQYSIT